MTVANYSEIVKEEIKGLRLVLSRAEMPPCVGVTKREKRKAEKEKREPYKHAFSRHRWTENVCRQCEIPRPTIHKIGADAEISIRKRIDRLEAILKQI